MKRHLLFAMLCIVGALNVSAQKDVTSQYITNATLADGTNGWTNKNFNTPVRGNNTVGYASESYAGWGSLEKTEYSLRQTITLPAGHYTLVNYSFFRYGEAFNTDASKSLAYLYAGSERVAVKTLGSITATGYANSQVEGANAFDSKMYRNTVDFTIDADNTPIEIGLEGTFDLMRSWMIAGMFELINNDIPATMDSPYDVTGLLTNPGFEYRDMTGWTLSESGAFGAQNNSQSFKVGGYYAEKWQASGALTARSMSQTLNNLPAGYYKLTANLGGDGTYLDLNGKTVNWESDKDYTVGYVLAENEALTITAGKTAEGTANWIHFDNFKLHFCGDVAAALTTLLNQVTSYEDKLPSDVYSQLQEDVAAYDQTYTDVDELLAAIAAVQALYEEADQLATAIDAWQSALTAARATSASTDTKANWVQTELDNVIAANDEDHVDQTSQEALETATAALIAANTLGQKSIHSYQVIAAGSIPDDSLDGWVCTNTNTFHINTWSVEGNPGNDPSGMVTPFIENWVGKGSFLGAGKIYYRLEGLEPGEVYRVSALVRSYNEASEDAPNGPNFYVLNDVADLTEVGTPFTYNGMSGIYGTQTAAATIGDDGILELGVVIAEDLNYNWVAFKNIQIGTYDAALEAAIAAAEALEEQVPAAYYSTNIQTVINTCTGTNKPTTVEGFETAIENLANAVTNAADMIAAYTGYLELEQYAIALIAVDNDNADANTTLGEALTTAQANIQTVSTVNEVASVNATLKDAMVTYAGAANPVGENAKFNLTFMLTDPDLTKYSNGVHSAGWFTDQTDGNSQVMRNNAATSEDGTKTVFYEYWTWNAKANDTFSLYTKVTLPEGTYDMSCYAYAQDQGHDGESKKGVYFYVNDTQGSLVDNARLAEKNVEFVQSNSQPTEVKVGLKSMNPNTYNWMGIGYVELYKVPAKTYEISENAAWDATTTGAGTVTLTRTISATNINTVVLPFSMTADEVAEYFGEGSKVYVVGSYENDNISFAEKTDGISANKPVLLKATQADTSYEIPARMIVATEDPSTTTGDVKFVGVYTFTEGKDRFVVPTGSYIVSNNEFRHVETEGTAVLKSTRAYFTVEGTDGVKALTFSFDDGEATGIATIEDGQLNILSGKIYDLSGREVKKPAKGVYIIDGKKVFIK